MPEIGNTVSNAQKRSLETKRALLEATIATVGELGYAATSTTEIAKRAGVSRGAQVHHYPTKAELVVDHMEIMVPRSFSLGSP